MWSVALVAALLMATPTYAADHQEAPGTQADPVADIADFYAWHTANGTTVAIITFDGLQPMGMAELTLDPEVLYTVHIDNNADNAADIEIHVQFAQNALGDWGVAVQNLPGADPVIIGNVEETLTDANGPMVWVGSADDPFFFDLQGFNETLTSETLAFVNTRDGFAGTNVSAIVLEFDTATAAGGSTTFRTWATTSRLP